jgi:hypothetical protein
MQVFHRSSNTIARASIAGGIALLAFLAWIFSILMSSSYVTGQEAILHQPVPFSHEHHVAGLGIDCRYCHNTVEVSGFAGMPASETCMNCHKQIWTNAELLEPVRSSFANNVPIRWQRVHDLPDFVYFNHSVHVAKGIGCASCHGEVDHMPLMYQKNTLQMEWCLDCHRNPGKNVRPKQEVFNLNWDGDDPRQAAKYLWPDKAGDPSWTPPEDAPHTLRAKLVKDYRIQSLTSCSTCHR